MIKVTVSERFADPPICLYDPESRICFVPGKLVDLEEHELTIQQRKWLEEGALVRVAGCGASLTGMTYVDLYRKAKEAGLRYAVRPKKEQLIEDLSAARKAAGVLTRPGGIGNG